MENLMNITISSRIILPEATPASLAPEVSAFPELSEPVLDVVLNFETDLLNQNSAPLPSDTDDDRRLRRNRKTRRLSRLVFQTMNQALILEADMRLTRCDLLVRERSPFYNTPSQWGDLPDSKLPEVFPNVSVSSWNSVFQFLKRALGYSFHIVYVSITDEMLLDENHWANEFMKWCFSECHMFLPEGTNLVFVPWLRTQNSRFCSNLMPSLCQFCVRNVSDSEIAIGDIVRRIILHRFLLLKAMIHESTVNAGRESAPDFAETLYLVQIGTLLNDGVVSNTSPDHRDTDMELFEEIRVLANNSQFDRYNFVSTVMSDPLKWTSESINLEQSEDVQTLYLHTAYFARRGNFGRGRHLPVKPENDELPADMNSKNIKTLEKLIELVKNIESKSTALVPANSTNIPSALALLFPLIGPYRCITYRSQNPPEELMDKLLIATGFLPQSIRNLMENSENECGLIEGLSMFMVFELSHCVLMHLNIIRNRTNQSKSVGFTWKLLELLANAAEAAVLIVLRYDTLESSDFKRVCILGLVKVLKRALDRASDLIEVKDSDPIKAKDPFAHCTEPFPEKTIERIRECVMRLDVDEWFKRIHNWNLEIPIFTQNEGTLKKLSLRDLAVVLNQIENHQRHTICMKSCTPKTGDDRSLVSIPSVGSGCSISSNLLTNDMQQPLTTNNISVSVSESTFININHLEFTQWGQLLVLVSHIVTSDHQPINSERVYNNNSNSGPGVGPDADISSSSETPGIMRQFENLNYSESRSSISTGSDNNTSTSTLGQALSVAPHMITLSKNSTSSQITLPQTHLSD